jgi:hypothetical protein
MVASGETKSRLPMGAGAASQEARPRRGPAKPSSASGVLRVASPALDHQGGGVEQAEALEHGEVLGLAAGQRSRKVAARSTPSSHSTPPA